MLNEEVARYRELSGDTNPDTPISHIGGYLDGYEKALEQEPYNDWYDVPSAEMTLEQARQAVKDLRKKLAELEQEPCPNAISRSDMLDAVGHGRQYTSEDLQRIIKGLPPVNPLAKDYNTIYYTPQPKTGHWIKDDITERSKSAYKHKCDRCGAYHRAMYDYCPSCGAKMIEPQESEGKE